MLEDIEDLADDLNLDPDPEAKPKRKASKGKGKGKTAKAKPSKPVKAAPKAKAKPSTDARTLGADKPDTDALILKLTAKKPMTVRSLYETGKFDYMKLTGMVEAMKRLYRSGQVVTVEQIPTGGVGRPAWSYKAA